MMFKHNFEEALGYQELVHVEVGSDDSVSTVVGNISSANDTGDGCTIRSQMLD